MRVVLVTPPDPLVSIQTLRKHLRVEHTEDDAQIEAIAESVQGWLDGPTGWLRRSLGRQTLEVRIDHEFPCDRLALPFRPLISVESVIYVDEDGQAQTLADSGYRVIEGETCAIDLAYNTAWPATRWQSEAIAVRYVAGCATPRDVPRAIVQAFLLLVGHYYRNREAVTPEKPEVLPLGAEDLLAVYRVWTP